VTRLRDAYVFLRRLENFIQAMRDQQAHDLPRDDADRQRLCVAMGYTDWDSLARTLDLHRHNVTREFEAIAFRGGEADAESKLEHRFAALWKSGASAEEWAPEFSGHEENLVAARRLVRLCESSSYVAAQIARYPALLDELLEPRVETERIEKAEFEAELESRVAHLQDADTEARMEALVQLQRANLFRIAVADFSGALPIMKVSDSLTFLAEAVLDYSLESAWLDLTLKHGAPYYEIDGERHAAGFGIIAYGKLGGLELSYGSDLDLVFLHDSKGGRQMTNGEKPLDNAMFFGRLVRRLVHFLTTQTSSGVMYEIDTRLRPEGRKGVLVTSIDAFERYQEENAWTWEHQALLRARPVAGSAAVAQD
jgi:glutamate-ammonia-ligase adenylyltransferase